MFRNLSPRAIGIQSDLVSTIALAKQHGWQGIDLPMMEVVQLVRQRSIDDVAALLAESGLRLGGWGLPLDWRKPYERSALNTLAEQAAVASRLGCTNVYTWVPPASDERAFQENLDFHIVQLQPISRVLDEHGCRLGLESIGPRTMREGRRYGFIYTLEGMLSLAQSAGRNVGLLVDSYHWYTSLGTLADLRSLRAADVVYVHVNDAPAGVSVSEQLDQVRRLPCATGVIDLKGFMQTLREIGYTGPVTPEPFEARLAELSPEQASQEAHQHMLELWRLAELD